MDNPFVVLEQRLANVEQLLLDIKSSSSEDQNLETQDRYVNKKEAAQLASVSTSTIDNWARSGKICRYYFGGSVRFWLPEVLEFLQSQIAR